MATASSDAYPLPAYRVTLQVRQVYWKLYNNLYIGAQDALVACYPAMADDPATNNTYARHELDMMI